MMLRYPLLVIGMALITGLAAQNTTPDRYFEAEAPLDMVSLRYVYVALNDLDPHADIFHSDDMRIVHVKANAQVGDDEIRAAFATAGVALKAGRWEPPTLDMLQTAPDGSPIHVLTNDAAADRARYQQAVEQWNAANPGAPIEILPNDR